MALVILGLMHEGEYHGHVRGRFDATVIVNRQLCREHFLLRLRIAGRFPPSAPGQFVQLLCCRPDLVEQRTSSELSELYQEAAFLRRPFSLAGRMEVDGHTEVEVIHRVVGVGTRWLEQLGAGDAVDLIGPLGNIFSLAADKSLALMVGGGVGLPPMFYLAEQLSKASWEAIAFVGARTHDLLAVSFDEQITPAKDGEPTLCVREFSQFHYPTVIHTEDGTQGAGGLITSGLGAQLEKLSATQRSQAVIFTCGPHAMMQSVAQLAQQFAVDCQACMEQVMACGMGTCQSCVVRIEETATPQATTAAGRPWCYRLACSDGPVFDAKQVVW